MKSVKPSEDGAELDSVARRTASGGVFLSGGSFVGFVLAALGSIGIARLLGPSSYGIVSVALIFPQLIAPITDLGFSIAVVRFASLEKDPTEYIGTIIVTKTATSAAAALGLFLLAAPVSNILGRPYLVPMIEVLSVYTFSYSLLSVLSGALVGLGVYGRASLINLLSSCLRVAVSFALVLSGLGVYGAIVGFPVGLSAVSAIALVLVLGRIKKLRFNKVIFRQLLSYSWPLYLPTLLAIPVSYFSNLVIALFLNNSTIGNYSVATNLILPVSVVSGSISTALLSGLPAAESGVGGMLRNLNGAIKYSAIIIPAVAMAVIALSSPYTRLVYGPNYSSASFLLILLALTGLMAPIGSAVLGTYFSSVGDTRTNMWLSFASLGVNVPVTLALVFKYGVVGIILGSFAASLASTLLALYIIKKKYSFKPELGYSFSLVIPSLLSAVACVLVNMQVRGVVDQFIGGSIVFLVVFALTLPMFARKEDLWKMRNLFFVVGNVGLIVSRLFDLELRLSDLFDSISILRLSPRKRPIT